MATPWTDQVRTVRDGQPVAGEETNRGLEDLYRRTKYLKEVFDAQSVGAALTIREVACSDDVVVGMAVYFNSTTQQYEPALAEVDFEDEVIPLSLSERGWVIGIVTYKYSDILCDIVINGNISSIDFSAVVEDPTDAGPYYLSAVEPGYLTKTQPPLGIFVAYLKGDEGAFVNPNPREVLEDHIHYAVYLVAAPAGYVNVPDSNGRVTINCEDDELMGWLPADHSSFDGLAPDGAKFGYNLAAHTALNRVFPPIPVQSCYLEKNGVGVHSDLCVVDANGIWWMTDCTGLLPWDEGEWATNASGSCSSSSHYATWEDNGTGSCSPLDLNMELRFWMTKMIFKTSNTVVTSLTLTDTSPARITNVLEEEASTGPLVLDIDLNFTQESSTTAGSLVVKELEGNIAKRGRVIEKIKPGSGVSISGNLPVDDDGYYQGSLVISFDDAASTRSGGVDIVMLDRAREEFLNGVPSITLIEDSSFSGKIAIPKYGMADLNDISLEFWITVDATGALSNADLSISYILIPPATTTAETMPIDSDSQAWAFVSLAGSMTAGQYKKITTTAISNVEPNSVLIFTITRGDAGSYTGRVSVVNVRYNAEATS